MNSYEIVFETDRLFLRKMTMNDVKNLQKIFADPIAMQYYPKTYDTEARVGWAEKPGK